MSYMELSRDNTDLKRESYGALTSIPDELWSFQTAISNELWSSHVHLR